MEALRLRRAGQQQRPTQITALVIACQPCAFVFWWMFDRYHKRVASRLKELALPRSHS